MRNEGIAEWVEGIMDFDFALGIEGLRIRMAKSENRARD